MYNLEAKEQKILVVVVVGAVVELIVIVLTFLKHLCRFFLKFQVLRISLALEEYEALRYKISDTNSALHWKFL